MKLLIKNMVCPRCIIVVKQLLAQHNLKAKHIFLGEIELAEQLTNDRLQSFSESLQEVGFELLGDRKQQLCEKIKTLPIQKIQQGEIENHFSVRTFLTASLHKDYSLLSRLFSECEQQPIEQFYILQKLEKAKEWLQYNQLPIAEIALRLGYSSSQHFSSQCKKVTSFSPLQFKRVAASLRQSINGAVHDKVLAAVKDAVRELTLETRNEMKKMDEDDTIKKYSNEENTINYCLKSNTSDLLDNWKFNSLT